MLQNYYDFKDTREQTQQSKVGVGETITKQVFFNRVYVLFFFFKSNKRSRVRTRGHQRQDSLSNQRTTSPRKKDKQSRGGSVVVYDIQHLLPINNTLAANYMYATARNCPLHFLLKYYFK